MSLNWAHVAIVYCSFSVDIIIDKVASKFGVFLKKLLVLLLIKVLHGRSVSLGRSALTAHMMCMWDVPPEQRVVSQLVVRFCHEDYT